MKEKLHSRAIVVNTYDAGEENAILVEGTLQDQRMQASRAVLGQETAASRVVHDLIVRMTVSLPKLRITRIEAEMPVIPHAACPEIKDCVQKLVGIEIRHGFTDDVRNLIGNTQGCIHLMNLILSMGSAAVQGMWAYFSHKKEVSPTAVKDVDGNLLLDTCWVWRKDGPFAKRLENSR